MPLPTQVEPARKPRGIWSRTLLILGAVLIVLGVAPMAYLLCFGWAHNFTPLMMPLPLKPGQVTSPIFKTDLTDNYQIDLDWTWTPAQRLDHPIDIAIDWRIVDPQGTLIQQGTFDHQGPEGNEIRLGFYQPAKRGLRQRIILDVRRDTPELASANPILRIETPERSLDQAYGSAFFMLVAAVIAGPGIILLIIGLILKLRRRAKA